MRDDKKIKAVIFDKDGVILDSEGVNIKTAIASYKEVGIDLDKEDIENVTGRHARDYNVVLSSKYQTNPDEMYKIEERNYYKFYQKAKLFDDVIGFIKDLKRKRVPLALATSGHMESVHQTLQDAGLEDVFDVIVSFEDCKARKPAPDVYLIAARKLNLLPDECIVFEDTFVGVEAAKAAGMRCVALPNEYTKGQDFSKADVLVGSINDFDINRFL